MLEGAGYHYGWLGLSRASNGEETPTGIDKNIITELQGKAGNTKHRLS
jgi:hypothetical protein